MADTHPIPAASGPPGIPRWVKALAGAGVLLVIVLVVVMLVAGGEHGPGRHTPSSAVTQAPSPSGSVAAGAVGGPGDAGDAARQIQVTTLDTMSFEPSAVDVAAGETVTFVVTNEGQAVHEFTLGDAAMQQEHAEAMGHMPGGMAHDLPNSLTLQPGETKRLTWRFGAAGSLEYACHEPGHLAAGMRGRIKVG